MIGAILTGGQEVRILFQHDDCRKRLERIGAEIGLNPEDVKAIPAFGVDVRKNREGAYKTYSHSTLCSIVIGPKEAEVSIGEGESWCAVGDNFCRATGREYALKRAIENGGFGREDTGILLASYYNRNRGQRKKEGK